MPKVIEELNMLHVQKRIARLRAEGYGWKMVARILKKLYGIQVNHATLEHRFSRNVELQKMLKLYEKEEELRKQEEELGKKLDVYGQLLEVNQLVRKYLYMAISKDQPEIVLACLREIRNQLELQSKLLGELKDRGLQFNIVNLTQLISEKAREADKKGMIIYHPREKVQKKEPALVEGSKEEPEEAPEDPC